MSNVPSGGPVRRGLGRGFEVLIGGAEPELARIAVDQIHPNPKQPRKRFDGEARVEPRPHEVDRAHELREPLERVVLGLHGDDHTVGGRECVDGQRAE